MRLYEYMSKSLFRAYNIPVPDGTVVATPAEVGMNNSILPAVVKAQILCGKRGKGGGILFAKNEQELLAAVERILGAKINGYPVEQVLVEERLEIAKELYLAIIIDRSAKAPVLLASASGGMDIEAMPPDVIYSRKLEVAIGLRPYVVQEVASFLELPQELVPQLKPILLNLYRLFREKDAELVEINPLVITALGKLVAADSKVVIDDKALYRHPELPRVEESTHWEQKARAHNIAYVELKGQIGVLANGAGITMATLDTLQHFGGSARNFLDIGGGASVEKVAKALEIIFATNPKALLINIFGGMTRCDDVATALVDIKKRYGLPVPVVIRMTGTKEEQGIQILRANGLEAYVHMEDAARVVVDLCEGTM